MPGGLRRAGCPPGRCGLGRTRLGGVAPRPAPPAGAGPLRPPRSPPEPQLPRRGGGGGRPVRVPPGGVPGAALDGGPGRPGGVPAGGGAVLLRGGRPGGALLLPVQGRRGDRGGGRGVGAHRRRPRRDRPHAHPPGQRAARAPGHGAPLHLAGPAGRPRGGPVPAVAGGDQGRDRGLLPGAGPGVQGRLGQPVAPVHPQPRARPPAPGAEAVQPEDSRSPAAAGPRGVVGGVLRRGGGGPGLGLGGPQWPGRGGHRRRGAGGAAPAAAADGVQEGL